MKGDRKSPQLTPSLVVKRKAIPLRSVMRQGCPLSPPPVTAALDARTEHGAREAPEPEAEPPQQGLGTPAGIRRGGGLLSSQEACTASSLTLATSGAAASGGELEGQLPSPLCGARSHPAGRTDGHSIESPATRLTQRAALVSPSPHTRHLCTGQASFTRCSSQVDSLGPHWDCPKISQVHTPHEQPPASVCPVPPADHPGTRGSRPRWQLGLSQVPQTQRRQLHPQLPRQPHEGTGRHRQRGPGLHWSHPRGHRTNTPIRPASDHTRASPNRLQTQHPKGWTRQTPAPH